MALRDDEPKIAAELERLISRAQDFERRLSAIELRLERAEQAAAGGAGGGVHSDADREAASDAPTGDLSTSVPALAGRTIMALGGAFLLRAMTESGAVPDDVGVASGLVYALIWTWLADRAGRAGRALDATLHGLTTILVALPLIAETTVRLKVMSPTVAAITLTAVAAVVLAVAWLRKLPALAWIVTLASTATGVALLFAMRSLAIFTPPLFVLAAASLAASYHRDWYGLRWPAALALDVLMLLAMLLVGLPSYEWLAPGRVAAVQLLITAMYLGIIGIRTLALGYPMREFGVVQSLLVLAIGLEGARYMLGPDFAWAAAFPWTAVVLAALSYAVSFVHLERDARHAANLAWYVTLGTILAIYGFLLLVPSSLAGVIWASMALAGALAGVRHDRHALRWNLAALAVAAAIGSGLAQLTYEAFWGADARSWVTLSWPALTAPGLCLAGWLLLRWRPASPDAPDYVAAGLALLAVGAIGIGSATAILLAPVAAGVTQAEPDLAGLAVVRTAVLVGASLLLAGLARVRMRRELVWSAYAALALAGLKIVVEDLVNGRAMTLFLSFVLFGGALIVTPRLVARRHDGKFAGSAGPEPVPTPRH